jgi:hypothetical protein
MMDSLQYSDPDAKEKPKVVTLVTECLSSTTLSLGRHRVPVKATQSPLQRVRMMSGACHVLGFIACAPDQMVKE